MDPFITGLTVLCVTAIVGLVVAYRSKITAAAETVVEDTGLEAFVAIQAEIRMHQNVIIKAKADLAQSQAKFRAMQTSVAQLVLPPEV